jgi:glycosyltransferase involved in cell wall biosynthesis
MRFRLTNTCCAESIELTFPQPHVYAEWPTISIVTPSFNQGPFLESCIQSILAQRYPQLQYVIVDGGSSDDSVDIIKKYSKHLHYWCSEKDDGQYDAINKGFRVCTGEIMAWLNSDDMYYPWALKTVASVMAELPHVQWLTTLSPGGWDINGFSSGVSRLPGVSRHAFLDGALIPGDRNGYGCIQQESTFWRRSLWLKCGAAIPGTATLAGDFELWSQFSRFSEVVGISSPLAGFRSQPAQRIRNIGLYMEQSKTALARVRKEMQWKPGRLRQRVRKLGVNKVPILKRALRESIGYDAQQVVRRNRDSLDASWELQHYRFL